MCGICGIVDFSGAAPVECVREMTRRMTHRGPDMEGLSSFSACVLGHRRLSILDLSDSARQPMISENGTVALIFNGEIYNFRELKSQLEAHGYRFKTTSDTEVLLALYQEKKEALLDDLNGMFSFAIWDEQEQRLMLARDRMGKKPLYYWVRNGRLSFASELYALLADPQVQTEIWDQALFEYLLYDFVPAPHTIFKEVHKLPAGHMAVFDAAGLRIRSYWTPPRPDEASDYDQTKARLEELLDDAVRLRLVSDVPLGAFLSGGIDSTLVTALMKQHVPESVQTFSIAFPGTTYDESQWSRLAADRVGTAHHEYSVQFEVEKIFPEMIRHFGEPFGDSSAIPTWHLCRQTRRGVTVALSGDGGDELFGGYERYLARRVQLVYDQLPASLREKIIEPLVEALPATTDYYGTSFSKTLKLFIQAARRIREEPLAVVPRTFSRGDVRALTDMDYQVDADPVLAAAREWTGLDPVSRMLFTDIRTYLAEDILTKVDRMSMAHSLEVRAPLLDYRVVEMACSMPLKFKLKARTTKRILKDVAKPYVPREILRRSKYGFQIPLGAWFKSELKEWARERLLDGHNPYARKKSVEKLWGEHQQGRADHTHRLWLILVLNEWLRQFGNRFQDH
ncbi:MAG: asparagine synthase (glutamine-hydrolyzing) [Thermodesulfobacteriota bacterium]